MGKASGSHTASFNYASVKQVIPEPATATLSLLALAGLAVRRRRR
ncbi:MAG: PEP-CTERM sorting domain-containing protein [Akkermansia sp.]|nr:PEP-CTERM sorting domain-containing protein [Akkermansia sp.]